MFWTLPFGKLFVSFFDGLRGGQKDDEEALSETCQSSSEEGKGQDTGHNFSEVEKATQKPKF